MALPLIERVFDASALLALVLDEPGADVARTLIDRAAVNAVNLAEAATKLRERGYKAPWLRQKLFFSLGLHVLPFTANLVLDVAELRLQTRHLGLSLGDRICIATGVEYNLPIVTAERAWARLALSVPILLIR